MSETKQKFTGDGNYNRDKSEEAGHFPASIVGSPEDSVVSVDFNTAVTGWNEGAERLYGYSASEVIGKPLTLLTLSRDLKELLNNIESVRDGDTVKVYETEKVRKDGRHINLLVTLSPVKDDSGQIIGVSFVTRDITRNKTAVENLSTSEDRYQTLSNSIDQGFCIIEMLFDENEKAIDYRFVEINPVFEKMTGIPNNEALSEKTAREVVPNLEDKWVEIYGKIALTGESVRFEESSKALNRWFDVYGFRIGGEESRKVALLFNDISQRKLAEDRLQRQRDFTSAITDSIGEGIYALDADGLLTFMNPAAEKILGWKESELLGRDMHEVIHFQKADGTHLSEDDCPLMEVLKSEKIVYQEDDVFTLRDDSIIPVAYTSSPIITDGKITGAVITFRDITKRKKAENALRESREMLNLAMSGSKMGAWSRNLENEEVEWSPQLEAIFGLPAGTFAGTLNGFYDYVHQPDREAIKIKVLKALKEKRDYIIEFRFRHADGSLRWMEGRGGHASYAPDGTPARIYGIGIDITERKQAEEKLRQSEERFRSVVNQSVGGISQADLTGRFIMVNDYYCEMLGYTRDELLKMRMQDISFPEDLPGNVELFNRLVTRGISFEIEKRCIRRDGSLIWVHNSVSIVRDAKGNPQNTVALSIDITRRKQAEEDLRKSDDRLRLAVDISQTATFEINLLTDAVAIDSIGRQIYGFEKDALLTFARVQSHFHPDDRDEVLRNVSAALAPEGLDEFEVEQRIIRTNGETRWIRVRGRAFFEGENESKRAVRCLGTYIDITERKQVEQEREQLLEQLETERLRLAYLFAKAPAFVAVVSGPEHTFEMTNPAYLQLIGHRDVVGKPVRQALPEVEGQGFFEILDDVFRTGEPFIGKELPIEIQREPNSAPEERFVDFVYQPIFEADKSVSGIFAHGVDITEQVEARRQAEFANRLKDEFLATLSHELRTPLNAVLGWSQMLQTHRLGESETKKALMTIERNARAQNQLIDDLLDVSRIITGKLPLNVRAVDLSSVITAAVDAARPAAEAKNIRLQTLLDPQAGPISGDPDRLQQVVWNLLSNAVKFTPRDGRVQVRLERVNSHVEIVISDTGKGIEEEFLPHVFDRFRQSDGSMTRRHGGLGLGLAIVRQLVELHGGSVSVSSAGEEKGSTFTVTVPLLPVRTEPAGSVPRVHPAAEEIGVPQECPPELSGLRVLLVEDEADSRELLNFVLDACGARITTASSAAEALETIKREKFDVLISDIGMPEEDGFSLIGKIRELSNEEGGDVPAIALTAYARAEDRVQALRAGFQMHVAKPVEPGELLAIVANLAGRMRNPQIKANGEYFKNKNKD